MTKHIGAHVSASGGVFNAITNAVAIGADAFALFTRNQRAWVSKPLDEAETGKFKRLMQEHNFAPEQVLPHDSYLINLGSPDPETLEKSRNAFLDEMRRVQQLGLQMLNFHPGSHLNRISEEECLDQIAREVNRALAQTEGVAHWHRPKGSPPSSRTPPGRAQTSDGNLSISAASSTVWRTRAASGSASTPATRLPPDTTSPRSLAMRAAWMSSTASSALATCVPCT